MKAALRIGAVLLLAAIAAALAWLAQPDRAAVPLGEAPVGRPVSRAAGPAVIVATPSSPVPTAKAPSLKDAFMAARDLRAFALEAMKRPADGGYLYAKHALELCDRDMATLRREAANAQAREIAVTGTLDARKTALGERYFSACASFAPGEPLELMRKLKSLEAGGQDPLVSAWAGAFDASKRSQEEVRAAAARMLAIADPLLLSRLGGIELVARSDEEGRKKMGLVFDGRLLVPQDGPEYVLASAAFNLAMCSPGAPCGPDIERTIACAAKRICPTHEEYVHSEVLNFGGTEQDWQQVQALADRVRQAIASRNVSFFVR